MSNALKKSVKVSGEMMQPVAVLITCRSQDHAQLKFLFELKKPHGQAATATAACRRSPR
jgi:hypothetical protein